MYQFAQEEKGLFTFYREQADFQELIKKKKEGVKAPIEQFYRIQKSCLSKSEHDKNTFQKDKTEMHQHLKKSLDFRSEFNQPINVQKQSINLKDQQISSKILDLLKKNTHLSRPVKKIKSIKLNCIEENQRHQQKESLRMRLYKEAKYRQVQRDNNIQVSKSIFTHKNQYPFKANPFQKLALQPKSFSSDLGDVKLKEIEKKDVHSLIFSKHKSKEILNSSDDRLENSQDKYKIKPKSLNLRMAEAIDDLSNLFCSQPLQKSLPKIKAHEKQDLFSKKQPYVSILNAQRLLNQYRCADKMQFPRQKGRQSQISRYKHEDVISILSGSPSNLIPSRKSLKVQTSNMKYSIFVASKEAKAAQGQLLDEKEHIFAHVMRKIKVK